MCVCVTDSVPPITCAPAAEAVARKIPTAKAQRLIGPVLPCASRSLRPRSGSRRRGRRELALVVPLQLAVGPRDAGQLVRDGIDLAAGQGVVQLVVAQ